MCVPTRVCVYTCGSICVCCVPVCAGVLAHVMWEVMYAMNVLEPLVNKEDALSQWINRIKSS